MKRWLTHLGALAIAVLPISAQPSADKVWFADFDQAVERAKREKKDLFVDFTGSDWCGWCIRLDNEVLSHQEFLEPVTRDFVLVKLDFPRSDEAKAKVPNPERNRELQAKYGVRGFPTILLMTAEGHVYGQTGYRAGGPEPYVAHLQQVRAQSRQALTRIQEQIAVFKAAEGDARLAAAEKLLAELQEQGADSPFASLIADALSGLLKEDVRPELKRGILRALIGSGQVDAALVESARQLDPKNEDGLYLDAVLGLIQSVSSEEQIPGTVKVIEDLLATDGVKSERELDLRVTAADWSHRFLNKPEAAKAHARRALELAPKENERLIDYLRDILDAD
jgi:thioredoxin-related protein